MYCCLSVGARKKPLSTNPVRRRQTQPALTDKNQIQKHTQTKNNSESPPIPFFVQSLNPRCSHRLEPECSGKSPAVNILGSSPTNPRIESKIIPTKPRFRNTEVQPRKNPQRRKAIKPGALQRACRARFVARQHRLLSKLRLLGTINTHA